MQAEENGDTLPGVAKKGGRPRRGGGKNRTPTLSPQATSSKEKKRQKRLRDREGRRGKLSSVDGEEERREKKLIEKKEQRERISEKEPKRKRTAN